MNKIIIAVVVAVVLGVAGYFFMNGSSDTSTAVETVAAQPVK